MFPPVLNEVFLSLELLRGTSSANVPAWNSWFIQTDAQIVISQSHTYHTPAALQQHSPYFTFTLLFRQHRNFL